MNETSETIDAVETSCEILSAFQEEGPMGVTEISNALNLSKSTVHRHLQSLRVSNFVVKHDGQYQLSLRFLAMAERVKDQFVVYDDITDTIDELSNETGEVVQFAVEEQERLQYIYKSEGDQAIRVVSDTGYKGNFHCTGLGKAILANLPEKKVDSIIDSQGLERKTNQTITKRKELNEALDEIRENGYATDDEEFMEGLRCIAAPVVLNEPSFIGAISVSVPARRIKDEKTRNDLIEKVLDAANVIEVNTMVS